MKDIMLKVALADNCMSTSWIDYTIPFSKFCEKVRKPKVSLTKDVGGFVGGWFEEGNRTLEGLQFRSMWTADLDKATTEFLNDISNRIDFCSVVYTTRNHTPENPRLRILAPFSRIVSVDEYRIINNYLVKKFGEDMFDPKCSAPNQLMFWPSLPNTDCEYINKEIDKDILDVDQILNSIIKNNVQTKSKQKLDTTVEFTEDCQSVINNIMLHCNDPRLEPNFIGLFCRTYTITEAIKTFLTDVYEPTNNPNRFTYKNGHTSNGLWIANDIYAYSHHSTDIANTKHLLNAFELVCKHKYNDNKKVAISVLKKDPKVKQQLVVDKYEANNVDYSKFNISNWCDKLSIDKNGELEDTIENVCTILENDPRLKNFAKNGLSDSIEVIGWLPWDRKYDSKGWTDDDLSCLKRFISKEYIEFTTDHVNTAITTVTKSRSFHPIRNYLDNLPEWDNVPRVDNLLINTMKADNNDYVKAVTRKTLVAAVARIYNKGVKFDNVLVLDGVQGIGKSTLFKELVGDEYYSDSLTLTDMLDKTAAEKLQGNWIVEIAELAGMKKTDIEKMKSFISSTNDKYRPTYARATKDHQRQCILIATVNGGNIGYLRDVTGNRRFWIVKLHQTEPKKMWNLTKDDVNQIWAEVKYYYMNGEKLYLDNELYEIADEEQRKVLDVDERVSNVEMYLDMLLPDSWNMMTIAERRQYFKEYVANINFSNVKGTNKREFVCIKEIWCECFGKEWSDLDSKNSLDSTNIAKMLRYLNWYPTGERKYVSQYTRERIYRRKGNSTL